MLLLDITLLKEDEPVITVTRRKVSRDSPVYVRRGWDTSSGPRAGWLPGGPGSPCGRVAGSSRTESADLYGSSCRRQTLTRFVSGRGRGLVPISSFN